MRVNLFGIIIFERKTDLKIKVTERNPSQILLSPFFHSCNNFGDYFLCVRIHRPYAYMKLKDDSVGVLNEKT